MSGERGSQATILVVEDEPWTRRVIAQHLEEAGYRVLQATNGFSGLILVLRERPDVIILDLILPELLGSQLLDELRGRAETRAIPIIGISASPASAAEGQLWTGRLRKPFPLERLLLLVAQVLRGAASDGAGVATG